MERQFECSYCFGVTKTYDNSVPIKCTACGKDVLKEMIEGKIVKEITLEDMAKAKTELYEVYDLILKQLDYWMDLPEETKKIIAIWIIGSYMHESFNTYPYLFFNAMRGSGKTRLLRVVAHLGNKGDGSIQNDMKEAVLFRMERNKILCIDEFENVGSKEKATLRQILNSAYKKGLKVSRMKKVSGKGEEKFVKEDFEPYMPVCMANIWGMDEVLGDRSITIILEKSNNPAKVKLIEDFDNKHFKLIKSRLNALLVSLCHVVTLKTYTNEWNNYINTKYRHYNDINTNDTKQHHDTLKEIELEEMFNKIDEQKVSGRNFELMFPLLITAHTIHKDLFDELLKILSDVMSEKQKDEFAESKDVSLYEFISTLDSYRFQWIKLKELCMKFRSFIGEEDNQDMWLNEKWLGRALKRLSLFNQTKRMYDGRQVLLNIDKAKDKTLIFRSLQKEDKE